jgi:integrase
MGAGDARGRQAGRQAGQSGVFGEDGPEGSPGVSACRELSRKELRGLLDACTGPNGLRDRTYVLLATTTGYRVSEMLSLRRKDVVDYRGIICGEIDMERKRMKGKKSGRTVPVDSRMRSALAAHLAKMEEDGLVLATDPLFQTGKRTHRAMGRSAVWKMIRRRAKSANLDLRRIGTHSLRKTFVAEIQKKCREIGDSEFIRRAQDALGHAEITSTTKYLMSLSGSAREESFAWVSDAVFGEAAP